MRYLNLETMKQIHQIAVKFFDEVNEPITPFREINISLLESALHAPQTSFGDTEKYRSLEMKAAALLYSLTQNHSLHNGNKRMAVVATDAFLYINGKDLIVGATALYNYALKIADSSRRKSRDRTIRNAARWIKKYSRDI